MDTTKIALIKEWCIDTAIRSLSVNGQLAVYSDSDEVLEIAKKYYDWVIEP